MKNPKISFRAFDGSGPLSITWFPGPLGDAVEAENSIGVGFFSQTGQLLSVEFDDVQEKLDKQHLDFKDYRVELEVKNKKVTYTLSEKEKKPSTKTRRSKTNEAA